MGRFRPRGNRTQRVIGKAVGHAMRKNGGYNSAPTGCLLIIINFLILMALLNVFI